MTKKLAFLAFCLSALCATTYAANENITLPKKISVLPCDRCKMLAEGCGCGRNKQLDDKTLASGPFSCGCGCGGGCQDSSDQNINNA